MNQIKKHKKLLIGLAIGAVVGALVPQVNNAIHQAKAKTGV